MAAAASLCPRRCVQDHKVLRAAPSWPGHGGLCEVPGELADAVTTETAAALHVHRPVTERWPGSGAQGAAGLETRRPGLKARWTDRAEQGPQGRTPAPTPTGPVSAEPRCLEPHTARPPPVPWAPSPRPPREGLGCVSPARCCRVLFADGRGAADVCLPPVTKRAPASSGTAAVGTSEAAPVTWGRARVT